MEDSLEKIRKIGLTGRSLELFFPLFLIAEKVSNEVLEKTLIIAQKIIEEKQEEDVYENTDVSLIDFVAKQEIGKIWIPTKEFLMKFRENLDLTEKDKESQWLNIKWLGRALKRLSLIKEKRRLGRGVEVILNVEKAKKKIRMFKNVKPKTEEKHPPVSAPEPHSEKQNEGELEDLNIKPEKVT